VVVHVQIRPWLGGQEEKKTSPLGICTSIYRLCSCNLGLGCLPSCHNFGGLIVGSSTYLCHLSMCTAVLVHHGIDNYCRYGIFQSVSVRKGDAPPLSTAPGGASGALAPAPVAHCTCASGALASAPALYCLKIAAITKRFHCPNSRITEYSL